MRVSIIGSGYVGIVVGTCLAKLGNKVTIIDIDKEKTEVIDNKKSSIYEEGLNEILEEVSLEATVTLQG